MSIQHKKVKQKLKEKKNLTFLYKKKYDFISKTLGETKLYSIDELINLGLPVFQLSEEPCYFNHVFISMSSDGSLTITISYTGIVLNIIVNYNNNTFVFPVLIYLSSYDGKSKIINTRTDENGKTIIEEAEYSWSSPCTAPYLFYTGTQPQSFKFLHLYHKRDKIEEVDSTPYLFKYIFFEQRYGLAKSPYLKLVRLRKR